MIAYLDASAIVSLLVEEPSSHACRQLWNDADDVVTADAGAELINDDTVVAVSGDRRLLGALRALSLATYDIVTSA